MRWDRFTWTEHALRHLVDRGMAAADVVEAVRSERAEVIESRPDDPRGPCHLVLSWIGNMPIHILVADAGNGLGRIVTFYEPDSRFESDFRTREPRGGHP